ncbi:MAG: DNA damage-inducible protein D [bacterium]
MTRKGLAMDQRNLPIQKRLDDLKRYAKNGGEYWMAREIQPILGYSNWQNFESVVLKGFKSCESAGVNQNDHFIKTSKVIVVGKGAQGERGDYFLTRYACYLIAMNGNPGKPEISLAQTYFAVQTRKMEALEALTEDERRLELRNRVKDANNDLNIAAKSAGVQNYALFHDAGYRGLYDMGLSKIKQAKEIPKKENLLDRAGRVELAANEFRITQCEEKLIRNKVQGQEMAMKTHQDVGKMVRDTIKKIGGTMPEKLPAAPHIRKIAKEAKAKKKISN